MADAAAGPEPLVDDLLRALHGAPPGDVWIALSGGRDSTVLLHAASEARKRGLPGTLQAVHVDHGLHPQSVRWASHCRAAADALGIPCHVLRVDAAHPAGESPEAAARSARYAALAGVLAENDRLLTAHHRDDQAETLLLQLLRGAGVSGLAAMPATAPLGRGLLLRPWLARGRDELAAHAERFGLRWIEDPSNAESRFDRNYLRRTVMPALQQRWPSATVTLARSAAHCAEAAALLAERGDDDLAACGDLTPGAPLPLAPLRRFPAARRRNLLRRWLRRAGAPLPSTAVLERLCGELLDAPPDRDPRVAWGGVEARRSRDALYLMRQGAGDAECFDAVAWDLKAPLRVGGGRLEAVAAHGEGLSAGVAGRRLELRPRRGGESLRPVGASHRRTLKRLYQERGVPSWQRRRRPLLYVDGRLAAVPGLWIDAEFAAAPDEPGWALRWHDEATDFR